MSRKIENFHLVPLSAFPEVTAEPVNVFAPELSAGPRIECPQICNSDSRIVWAHRNIAAIAVLAGKISSLLFGWRLRVIDCLRTVEAQEEMVRYGFPLHLLAPPGDEGHLRGMALHIVPERWRSNRWDDVEMGSAFDQLPKTDGGMHRGRWPRKALRGETVFEGSLNRRFRAYMNRRKLEFVMLSAAEALDQTILPLPNAWWEFALPDYLFNDYPALREEDLLPCQRVLDPDLEAVHSILEGRFPDEMLEEIRKVRRRVHQVWRRTFWPEFEWPRADA